MLGPNTPSPNIKHLTLQALTMAQRVLAPASTTANNTTTSTAVVPQGHAVYQVAVRPGPVPRSSGYLF